MTLLAKKCRTFEVFSQDDEDFVTKVGRYFIYDTLYYTIYLKIIH